MKKNLAKMLWLSAISVVLVGCGLSDENSPESCKFEVSQSLDKGDYDTVIQKLSSDPTCGGAYTEEEGQIQRAAAYIGKAGFSIPDLISDIIDSASKDTGTYQAFVQSVAKKVNSQSIDALMKAKDIYEKLAEGHDCSSPDSLPDIIKDACFYKNITNTATATSSLTLVIGGGSTDTENIVQKVESWANPSSSDCNDLNDNGIGDAADVTAAAIEYALHKDQGCDSIEDKYKVNCSVLNSSLTFTKNKDYTYTLLEIDVNDLNNDDNTCDKPYTEYRLIYPSIDTEIDDTTERTVVLTSGYCETDFTPCQPLNIDEGCYPCPIIVEKRDPDTQETVEDTLDITDTVVDLINNTDVEEIANIVGDNTGNGENKDIVQDIKKLKQDICGEEGYCELKEIKDYLTKIQSQGGVK